MHITECCERAPTLPPPPPLPAHVRVVSMPQLGLVATTSTEGVAVGARRCLRARVAARASSPPPHTHTLALTQTHTNTHTNTHTHTQTHTPHQITWQGPFWVSTWRTGDGMLELRVSAHIGLNVLCYVHRHGCLLGAGSAEGAGASGPPQPRSRASVRALSRADALAPVAGTATPIIAFSARTLEKVWAPVLFGGGGGAAGG